MRKTKFQFFVSALLAFSMVQAIELGFNDHKFDTYFLKDQQAYAKSSAGRSKGGSFRRSTPSNPRSSSPSKSSPTSAPSSSNNSKSSSDPSNSTDRNSFTPNRSSNGNSLIVVPNSSYRNGYNSPNSSQPTSYSYIPWFIWLIIFLIILILFMFVYLAIRAIIMRPKKNKVELGAENTIHQKRQIWRDLGNETFTVSKLQVALFAQAREVQSRLTELALEVDTDSLEGLMTLMKESAIALMRTPENWTHALASSQSMARGKAEEVFNRISLKERTKFSHETLVNVGGKVAQRSKAIASPDKDPSAYIVVTLLIGTEHDKPLFGEIKNIQELRQALEVIASIPASHLSVFELLWSPQADTDSLTYDELLTEYSNMIQI
jgi:uncharacterized membrane protein